MNNRLLLARRCAAILCAGAVVILTGCGSSAKAKAPKAAARAQAGGAAQSQVLAADLGNQRDAGQGDPSRSPDGVPRGPRMRVVQLDIYKLEVPYGAISRSEEFWTHIDEQQVDVGTYDLLRKNGWRLGTAPHSEWGYFKDIIDAYPASAKPFSLAAGAGAAGANMELPLKKGVMYQVINYFNDDNRLHGLSFDDCDNLLNISVHQLPRKPGAARVTVCPTVRSQKRRYEVTRRGEEREIRYVHPERLYNLNLQSDIAAGDFLVIAPSPEGRWETSLGAAFLVADGPAERKEQVLLLVPKVVTFEESGIVPTAAATRGAQE